MTAACRARSLFALLAIAFCACSLPKGLDPLPRGPHLGSFMGVSFGDQSTDVAARFPQAVPETSPFGAETLRLSDVKSGSVTYKTVVFEFLWHGGGMQLVMVRFAPSYGTAIAGDLTQRLGTPRLTESAGPHPTPEAQWHLADGTNISLNSSMGRLVIVGPSGKILTDDIRMREEKGEEFAS